jgi:Transposase, Mutator family
LVADDQARTELTTDLDQLFREGARRMLVAALEAEVDAYLTAHAELVDERGHRLLVRNGHAPARTITTGVGQVEVVWPRVDDRRTDPARPAAAVPQRAAAPLAPALLQGGRGATAAVPAWTVQLKRTVAFWSRRHRRREPLPLRRCPEGRRVPRSAACQAAGVSTSAVYARAPGASRGRRRPTTTRLRCWPRSHDLP